MAKHTPLSATNALYRIFIAPNVSTAPFQQCRPQLFTRALHATRVQAAQSQAASTPAVIRKEKWNEEITSRKISLVNPATGKLDPPVFTRDLLLQLNLKIERLVQVTSDDGSQEIPVCKVINIKEAQKHEAQRSRKAKEQKRLRLVETTVKTAEMNWAIDLHDLQHRLSRVKEWLGQGRRVEVVLAPKRNSRTVGPEECQHVISKILAVVNEVPGAKLLKPMEGQIGKVVLFQLQGKSLASLAPQTSQTSTEKTD